MTLVITNNTTKFTVRVTENTNQMAERLGYNICHLPFYGQIYDMKNKTWRGFIELDGTYISPLTLHEDDLERL